MGDLKYRWGTVFGGQGIFKKTGGKVALVSLEMSLLFNKCVYCFTGVSVG